MQFNVLNSGLVQSKTFARETTATVSLRDPETGAGLIVVLIESICERNFSKTLVHRILRSFCATVVAEYQTPKTRPGVQTPLPPSGSGGGAAGALLAAASSAFWRIRSASRGTLLRPRTRSWIYSHNLTPNRRHVFFTETLSEIRVTIAV